MIQDHDERRLRRTPCTQVTIEHADAITAQQEIAHVTGSLGRAGATRRVRFGATCDPRRVNGPGLPVWDEPVVGNGDYAALRVWGADLLAAVSDELDALMPRLNRAG